MRAACVLGLMAALLAACDGSGPAPTQVRFVGALAPVSVEAGYDTVRVDLAPRFQSAEALTFAATAAPAGVARVAVNGARLTVAGTNAGTATVTVAARTAAGASATGTFAVTVTPPGIVALAELPGEAALRAGADTFRVRLGAYFRSRTTAPLTYALAAATGPLAARIAGADEVVVTGTGDGAGRVTVRIGAGGRTYPVELRATSTTRWCPSAAGQRLFGVPRTGGDLWRFALLDADRTGPGADTLRGTSVWTITGGECLRGEQAFEVEEARTGTRTQTAPDGARTTSPFADVRRFALRFEGPPAGAPAGARPLSLGPYEGVFRAFGPTTSDPYVTSSVLLLGGEVTQYEAVLSFAGGLERYTAATRATGPPDEPRRLRRLERVR